MGSGEFSHFFRFFSYFFAFSFFFLRFSSFFFALRSFSRNSLFLLRFSPSFPGSLGVRKTQRSLAFLMALLPCAIAVRRGSYKSLFLPNSDHVSLENKGS